MGRKDKLKLLRKKDKEYKERLEAKTLKPIQIQIDELRERYSGYKDSDRLIYPQLIKEKKEVKLTPLEILKM
jgi:hypothetical protein